ncbi:MAG: hypothetical protein ABIZ50_07260, partial [Solirubrobacterales bacterium]
PSGGGGNPPDITAPDTHIDQAPKRVRSRRATIKFSSSESGSSFECRLDGKGFSSCGSPTTLKRLKRGKHSFDVRATDAAGNVDATPARATFRVRKRR